ncbi:Sulfite exporter TauE/SafE [Aliarcobacter thereius]|uniref:sulfite exporter TauE/SafE family protein n=1 Tax=Aliarcobacter thereius TaxID=544718 RepID=UPI00082870A8|nr:sulfite exporter TauE/SafE family protein [Aliarcobacter thereius]OCL85768.1 Sulfite exporter TauE/SafE [Aliarcobacter thereius]
MILDINLFFVFIILFASILQTSSGFGFSIMATPFLLILFLPYEAIQINLILSLIISILLLSKIKDHIDFILIKRLFIGSILGIPCGIFIFKSIDTNVLKLLIAVIILILTILLIFNLKIKSSKNKDYIIGGISACLTSSIGMPGPPLLLYFTGINISKEKLRATTLAFYLFIYSFSLISQIIFVGTNHTIWKYSIYSIPIVFMGLIIGQIFFKYLNQNTFKIFTFILLFCTSITLFIEVLLK